MDGESVLEKLETLLGDDGLRARSEMQAALLRSFFWLLALAAAALAVRESIAKTPILAAALATAVSLAAALWSRRWTAPKRALGFALFVALVLLVTKAALDLGGAAGSALSFAFLPGFLAVLVLGPAWGWSVCALMLGCFVALGLTTPLGDRAQLLRFLDEAAMTLFATALAHTLILNFSTYEVTIAGRRSTLQRLRDKRQALTLSIYEQLEPLAAQLVRTLPSEGNGVAQRTEFKRVLQQLNEQLHRAKLLAQGDDPEPVSTPDADLQIRTGAMRVWLRLAAPLLVFFIVRNVWVGAPFAPTLFSLGFCGLFYVFLGHVRSTRYLEVIGLAIGLCASGPLIVHIHAFGATPDAPPLVVAPATVLFTALLSRGPATWTIVALNFCILLWVGVGKDLTLVQSRLLGDLALSFIVVVVALRSVFQLRSRYARTLLDGERSLSSALRQHRRLAGTLFHDVANHLQVLSFLADLDEALDLAQARSLTRRVQRLITLSKEFLLTPSPKPSMVAVPLSEAVELLNETFRSRWERKKLRLEATQGMNLCVLAQPELLVECVLGNLLSNAAKFSPASSTIRLSADRVEARIRILVSDAGPGIPAEVLARLGQDGAVPSRLGTAGERGQGYGLQLVQEHLERMGGRLELINRAEGGLDAIVWLNAP